MADSCRKKGGRKGRKKGVLEEEGGERERCLTLQVQCFPLERT